MKRTLSLLLTVCMVLALLPTVVLAAGSTTTVSGTNIFANGTPIEIVAGTTADYTNILYDKNGNGVIEDTEYLQIGGNAPTATGYNLSGYTIYGGCSGSSVSKIAATHVTINGGKIGSV
jgi:hypothetical protein